MLIKKSSKKARKSYMILLEVLIAMAIVALCILPLIAPQAFLLKQQQQFNRTLQLDTVVDLFYIEILERLHKNSLPWKDFTEGQVLPIDATLWQKIGVKEPPKTVEGSFQFKELSRKIEGTINDPGWSVHLFNLTFTFVTKNEGDVASKTLTFPYTLSLLRHQPLSASSNEQGKKKGEDDKKKNPQPDSVRN